MVGNWNRCVQFAKAPWIIMCHDDDLLSPFCVDIIEQIRNDNANCQAVLPKTVQLQIGEDYDFSDRGCSCCYKKIKEGLHRPISRMIYFFINCIFGRYPLSANLFCNNVYGAPSAGLAVAKEAIHVVGGWQDGFTCVADWWMGICLTRRYEVIRAGMVTGAYRWGENETLTEWGKQHIIEESNVLIKRLIDYDFWCDFYFRHLQPNFIKQAQSQIFGNPQYSFIYKMLRRFYSHRNG